MPKPTRIYTRTGDDGTTGLVGGPRIKKHALRIAAYGTTDEASSTLGLARAHLNDALRSSTLDPEQLERVGRRLEDWLSWVQNCLFNIGSDLATLPEDRWASMPLIKPSDVAALERAIDEAERDLPPLANFIHPSGSRTGATLHLARTITRRAERLIVELSETESLTPDVLPYLNRLSDATFVWARWINQASCEPEALWQTDSTPPAALTA